MGLPSAPVLPAERDKQVSMLLESQRRVLERIASGAQLPDTLELLVRLIEAHAGDMRCSVLLADAGAQRLRFVAAPSIPADFKAAMEPYLGIGRDMGQCGRAAYLRQPVYTRDTATDPGWHALRELALRHGLRAIWSTPIISDDNVVLGTFAVYYGEPRLPAPEHVKLIDMATQLARVAIEAKADDEILRAVFDSGPRGIVITDLTGHIVRANRAFAEKLGYSASELRGKALREISVDYGRPCLANVLLAAGDGIVSERRYRTKSGAVLWARERSTLRRGPDGDAGYVLIRIAHLSEAGHDPLNMLSRRERQVLELVVTGRTSKQIASTLGIGAASVDTYRSRVMLKLGVEDLTGLVRFAIRHGVANV